MFQHFRSRQRTFFVDMPDDDKGYITGLGELKDACSTLAHLCQTADTRFYGISGNRLYRIHYDHFGFQFFDLIQDTLERCLAGDKQVLGVACQSFGTQFDLTCGLLARCVERLAFTLLHQHLQRQCRFADTGFATQEHQTAGHQTTT